MPRRRRRLMDAKLLVQMPSSLKQQLDNAADVMERPAAEITRELLSAGLDQWQRTGSFFRPEKPKAQQLPLLGAICAGEGIEVLYQPPRMLPLPEGINGGGSRYLLKVVGDSMDGLAGHSIADGMVALFDSGRPRYNNCVAHVEWKDGEGRVATVRKLRFHEGDSTVILQPTNPKYKPRKHAWNEIEVKGVLITAWPEEAAPES